MRAISLFAGAGGCSLGFSQRGVEIIAAFDNDNAAVQTYNKNFCGNLCRNVDLSECDFQSMRNELGLRYGEIDLVIGGPPCQGFTTAGGRFWDDPRNKLIQNYVHALEQFFPRWFMMENVEGILTTRNGVYLLKSLEKMIELGYSINLEKIYAQEFGVPQRRKRVLIVGNREGKTFRFPQPKEKAHGAIYKKSTTTLRNAIEDLERKEDLAIDHVFKSESEIQLTRIKNLQQGQSMKDLPEELQHESFKRRSKRRVCDGTPSEKRGGAPAGMKRLNYDEPCLTITSVATSEFIHPIEDRCLTIRECARIQTFPDSFGFCGTERQKLLQIGNAIPPLLASQMADAIYDSDSNSKGVVQPGLIYYSVTKATAKSPVLEKVCENLNELMLNTSEQLRMMI